MNKMIQCTIILVLFAGLQSQAKTTVTGVETTSTRLTLDSKNSGVVKNLFELGSKKFGNCCGGGYSSMDHNVALPRTDLISRLGHSTVPGQTPDGQIVTAFEHYQMNLNFNFVNNDYELISRAGKKILKVYGTVADELIDLGLNQTAGIVCVRNANSVCSITVE